MSFNSFLNLLVWASAMHMLNVECRLPEEDVILKDPPPMSPPLRGGTSRGGRGLAPPRTPLVHIMYERATPTNAQNTIVFF